MDVDKDQELCNEQLNSSTCQFIHVHLPKWREDRERYKRISKWTCEPAVELFSCSDEIVCQTEQWSLKKTNRLGIVPNNEFTWINDAKKEVIQTQAAGDKQLLNRKLCDSLGILNIKCNSIKLEIKTLEILWYIDLKMQGCCKRDQDWSL